MFIEILIVMVIFILIGFVFIGLFIIVIDSNDILEECFVKF